MHSGTTARPRPGYSFQPARVAGLAILLASAVLVTAVGVTVGEAVRSRLTAGPTPAQQRVLERIDAQPVVVPKPAADEGRGPNRADLGGGRAQLGADR